MKEIWFSILFSVRGLHAVTAKKLGRKFSGVEIDEVLLPPGAEAVKHC